MNKIFLALIFCISLAFSQDSIRQIEADEQLQNRVEILNERINFMSAKMDSVIRVVEGERQLLKWKEDIAMDNIAEARVTIRNLFIASFAIDALILLLAVVK